MLLLMIILSKVLLLRADNYSNIKKKKIESVFVAKYGCWKKINK